jgi:hypothetical protein
MGVAPEAIAEKIFPGIGSKDTNSFTFFLEIISPRVQGEVSHTFFDIFFLLSSAMWRI